MDLPTSTNIIDKKNPRLQWLFNLWLSMFDALAESDLSSGKPDAAAALLKTVPTSVLQYSDKDMLGPMLKEAFVDLERMLGRSKVKEFKRREEANVDAEALEQAEYAENAAYDKNSAAASTCFPFHSTVTLSDGTTKSMEELQVGDNVNAGIDATTGESRYEPVHFFSHADREGCGNFVELYLSDGRNVTLSDTHYIPLIWEQQLQQNGDSAEQRRRRRSFHHVYAKDVQEGDTLLSTSDDIEESMVPVRVVRKVDAMPRCDGLYNPYTPSGFIVVDGILMSCHSEWILDPLLSGTRLAPYIQEIYQLVFWPLRRIYGAIGPTRVDEWFGAGNPARTDVSRQTTIFYAIASVTVAVAVAVIKVAVAHLANKR